MIGRRLCKGAPAALLLSLLAACATVAPPAGEQPSEQAAAARRYQDDIEFAGRLSVRYQGPMREEALHGGFNWKQAPGQISVALLSPLGQTMALIDVTPAGASLTQAGQPARAAADVDALTAETLGWPLPIAGLRDWLQGFAVDAQGRRFMASPASSMVTTRDGWRINYAGWQDEGPAAPRPRRIDLARHTAQAGDVSIRIVIDTWQAR